MKIENINPAIVWTSSETPPYTPGEIYWQETDAGSKAFIFIEDSGAGITNTRVALIEGVALTSIMASTTTSAPGTGQGKLAGVCLATIAAGGYGWLQIYGPGSVRAAALCAAYTQLNTTGTAGQLDDDATSGAEIIDGIILEAARGATDGAAACFINWPRVGRTL